MLSVMSTVAEQLRQAREACNLTVQQVAEITKLRTDHVRALEEGNYDVFSAPVYIRGFVRTYSTLLRMDVPELMCELDEELRQTKRFAEPPSLTGEPHGILDTITFYLSKVDWRQAAIVIGGAAVLVAIFLSLVAWNHHRKANPTAGVKPAMVQAPRGETLPVPATPTTKR
jgi:cytoskeletal protein RodZ